MTRNVDPRPMTANEIAVVAAVVDTLDEPTRSIFTAQLATATIIGGSPTLLDLAVDASTGVAGIADGPVPVRAVVPDGRGEVLVWVTGGVLSALEYAWTTDDVPTEMPPASGLVISTSRRPAPSG